MLSATEAEQLVIEAAGRPTLSAALSWIAKGHALVAGADQQALLRALSALDIEGADEALQQIARAVTQSDLNTAAQLLRPEIFPNEQALEASIRRIAAHCAGGLARVTASDLIAAQRDDPRAVETLALLAGLTYDDVRARAPECPAAPDRQWTPSQVRAAFSVIDAVVRGTDPTTPLGGIPVRSMDLIAAGVFGEDAWERFHDQVDGGFSMGAMLAQRAAGGTWLQHRQRTSGLFPHALADVACRALAARAITYKRSTAVGGDTAQTELDALHGCDKRVTMVILDRRQPRAGVVFSVANDSGTAKGNMGKMLSMKRRAGFPLAVIVGGLGWAERNETGRLARAFQGLVFSDQHIDKFADYVRDELLGGAGAP